MISPDSSQKTKPYIFCWYGNVDFVIWETVQMWREAFEKKYSRENFISLTGSELKGDEGIRTLRGAVGGQSLFSTKRFVVLKEANAVKGDIADALAVLISTLHQDTTLVVWADGMIEEKSAWVKALREQSKTGAASIKAFFMQGSKEARGCKDTCVMVDGVQLAVQKFKKANVNIDYASASYLAQRAGDDLWQLHWDIEKCAAYVGANGMVTRQIIDQLSSARIEEDIFAFVDAVGQGNVREGFARLEEHLAQGSEPLYLVSMIARQARMLVDAFMNNGELAGVHPFVAKKIAQQLRGYSPEHLQRLVERLVQLEMKLKSTSLPPSALLAEFLLVSSSRK